MESGKRLILHTENVDLDSIAAAGDEDNAFTVVGARPGAVVMVSAAALDNGLLASAFVSDVDEVTLRVTNISAGPIDADPMDFFIAVTQG